MNATEVLRQIAAAGVRLVARGGELIASPRDAVTPELVDLIRSHQQELLAAIELHPLVARAGEMLREHVGDMQAVVGRSRPDGRCVVAIAIRNPEGGIDNLLLHALVDTSVLPELTMQNSVTIH